MSTLYMNIVLFAMMVATAIAIVRMNKLFAVVMLSGVFSLLAAMLFIVLDAVDVAFTEAAVGAGISTVLMLGTIALVRDNENKNRPRGDFAFDNCQHHGAGHGLWHVGFARVRGGRRTRAGVFKTRLYGANGERN